MEQNEQRQVRNYNPFNLKEGDVYGRLTYTGKTFFKEVNGVRRRYIEVKCECGVIKECVFDTISRGHTSSCGCYQKDKMKQQSHKKTHGLSNHRLFSIWRGMRERCYYEKHNRYPNYGGKGIVVCPEWKDDFKEFYNWALANGYKENLSLDRKYNHKNYEPTNCRFITKKRQKNNTTKSVFITAFKEVKTMLDWSLDSRCKVTYSGLRSRLGRDKENWVDIEKAITTPPTIKKENKSNKAETRMIVAFGKEKSLFEWLKDERCVADEAAIRLRLRKGWDAEKAITGKLRQRPIKK